MGETDSNIVTVGDFQTPLISSRPKLNQETMALNDTLNLMDIYIYIYIEREREREREYSKQSLSKCKKTEVISSISSKHNAMRLEIIIRKNTNSQRLNYTLVNNQWITEVIQEEIKRLGDKQEWKHNDPQFMGHSKITSNSKKKVYRDTRLPQEARKISNK